MDRWTAEPFWQWWVKMIDPAPAPDAQQERLLEMEQRLNRQLRQLDTAISVQRRMPFYTWWREKPKQSKHRRR